MIKCTIGKIPKTHWIDTSVVFFCQAQTTNIYFGFFPYSLGRNPTLGLCFLNFYFGSKTRLLHAEGNSIIRLWNTTTGKQRLNRATAWIVNLYGAKYFLSLESKTKLEMKISAVDSSGSEKIFFMFFVSCVWHEQKQLFASSTIHFFFFTITIYVSIVQVACFHHPLAAQKYCSFSKLYYPFYYQFWFFFLNLSSGISRWRLRGLSSLFWMDDSDSLKLIRQHFQLRSLVWIPIT